MIVQTLRYKKSTKGTHVFEDVSDNAAVSTLYVAKSAFALESAFPTELTLTISVGRATEEGGTLDATS